MCPVPHANSWQISDHKLHIFATHCPRIHLLHRNNFDVVSAWYKLRTTSWPLFLSLPGDHGHHPYDIEADNDFRDFLLTESSSDRYATQIKPLGSAFKLVELSS
jgi:hypothetical protein